MSLPDIGKHPDGRADDVLQGHHLVGFRDARLKDGQIVVITHLPHRKRHTYLRVITLRAANNVVVGTQHLKQPLLNDSLTVTTRDADDGVSELLAMARSQGLQSLQRVRHYDKSRLGINIFRLSAHHKGTDTFVIQHTDVLMSVIADT